MVNFLENCISCMQHLCTMSLTKTQTNMSTSVLLQPASLLDRIKTWYGRPKNQDVTSCSMLTVQLSDFVPHWSNTVHERTVILTSTRCVLLSDSTSTYLISSLKCFCFSSGSEMQYQRGRNLKFSCTTAQNLGFGKVRHWRWQKKKKRWSNTVQCFLTITCASLHKPRCVRTGRARCGLYQRRFLSSVTVIWRWLMMELPSLSHVAPWPHWQGQMVITPCVLCSKPQMEWTWRLWHGYDCVLVTAGEVPGWQWRSCWTAVSTTWTFWSQSRTTAG